jgi:hypothetical protein
MNEQDIEIYIVTFPDPMARGGHGLPKALPGPAIPYPSTPYGWTTPEMALRLFPFNSPRCSPKRLVVESIQTFGDF